MTYLLSLCIISLAVKINYFTHKAQKAERGIKVAKNLEVSFLLDFYGEMLTKKQHDFLVYYYNEDLSLSEIAENEGITRQGVRDAIKRAENQLFDMENRLGLAKRFTEMKKGLDEITQCAEAINEYNLNHSLSREINDNISKIKSTADYLSQL